MGVARFRARRFASVATLLTVAMVGACAPKSGVDPATASRRPVRAESLVDQPAPPIEHLVVAGPGSGELLDWSALRGRVLIVDFWATWCAPCRRSLPYFQALLDRNPDDLHVVGVSEDDGAGGISGFSDRFGLGFPLVWDAGQSIARGYGVRGLPTTFVLDRGGIVRHVESGFGSGAAELIEQRLAELIGEASVPE